MLRESKLKRAPLLPGLADKDNTPIGLVRQHSRRSLTLQAWMRGGTCKIPPIPRHKAGTALKRRPGRKLLCWGDAEMALAELARLERKLAGIDSRERQAVVEAQAEAEGLRMGPRMERDELAAALERFCRRELRDGGRAGKALSSGQVVRTRRLLFGWVGYRRSQAIRVQSAAAALRSLAKSALGRRFLRVRAEVDRERLRLYLLQEARRRRDGSSRGDWGGTPAGRLLRRLRRIGVHLEQRDRWFYKLDREALDHWG